MTLSEELFDAIQRGDAAAVEALLAAHTELLQVRDASGASAVQMACYMGHPQIAGLFVVHGAQLDLHEACVTGSLIRVRDIITEHPDAVNTFSADGYPPLGLAVFFGHADTARFLLYAGADVNLPSRNANRVAPLHGAVARGNIEWVRILLDRGADVNARQAANYTPLHGAAFEGSLEMVELLLSRGADPDAVSDDGKTPLMLAVEKSHMQAADRMRAYAAGAKAPGTTA